ncbi:GPR1/FUN34/yaaH family-domain-containing protein [Gongronella butleri]|nr:GPR1/FUN34/yaaH family-domain-containing protein [Gongronella butleri]
MSTKNDGVEYVDIVAVEVDSLSGTTQPKAPSANAAAAGKCKCNFLPLAFQGLAVCSIVIGFSNINNIVPVGTLPQMATGVCVGSGFLFLLLGAFSELLQGNLFTGTLLGTYSGYYLAYFVMLLPSSGFMSSMTPREIQLSAAVFDFVYVVPTFFFFLGTFKQPWLVRFLMFQVIGDCFLSGCGNALDNGPLIVAGGWFCITLGVTAWYISFSMIYAAEDTFIKFPII